LIRIDRRLSLFLAAIGLVFCISCSEEEAGQGAKAQAAADAVRKESERGPVKVTLELAPREPRLSDDIEFTFSIEAEEGVEVALPVFGDGLGDFIIRGFREPLVEKKGKRRTLRRIYDLEPVRTGEHLIYPMLVPFVDSRADGDGKELVVETEGISIAVQSVIEESLPTLEGLGEPEAPRPIPAEPFDRSWLLLGLVALPLAAAVLFLYRRKRQLIGEAPRPLTPQERARQELEELAGAGFLERSAFQDFYRELTGIVRRFIEQTTGIRAPELTTEEFLREIGLEDPFDADEQGRLQAFLEAADLVKFAAMRPGRNEIEDSFRKAGAFIGLDGEANGVGVPALVEAAFAGLSRAGEEEVPA